MLVRRDTADPPGKWLGLIVFALGIVLLAFVFYRGFIELVQTGLLSQTLGGAQNAKITDTFLIAIAKWLLLFLLAYVSSSIASRGIALYQASRGVGGEEG